MNKILASLRAYVREDHQGKPKFCATCGAPAKALFDVGDGGYINRKIL